MKEKELIGKYPYHTEGMLWMKPRISELLLINQRGDVKN
jgi:hypothetical protein